ncbi:phage tail protein [Paraclostridium sordellii]|uniref:phage tail protein n=1 Tax=Paraclostridium sordellii TaxID=1505 RepID=UPI000CA1E773|nr:phage tail protein [Paeniclostridium sordellii]AUN14107.1 hypothetical protein RSJ16_07690 [Paeniclostridium sordellii]
MIHLRTRNKKKIAGLVGYKDLYIESELQSGEKTLCFSYPKKAPYYKDIVEECYITTKENEYVIKERTVQDEYTEFKCILNLEDIEGKPFFKFESKEQPIDKALALALAGTGWIVGNCDLKKKRTVRMANCSSLEIIKEIKKIYRCDMVFNTLTKTIDVFEHLGEDKGVYFIDSLNLKSLGIQGNSYEYFTRLIPVGKDDLKITDINDKKEYVENYQYSNKVKTAYWVDDRYTIKENLKEDAIAKLNEISKPFRSYSAAVFNLAKLNKKYKNILDYKLGDTITLISKEDRFKDKQRIVKTIEFPDEHEKDSVELANTTLCFEDIQTQFQEAADTVENITTDNGTVKGSTIDGIETKQIKDFHQEVVSATNIKAINAQIVNLEAHNVTISGQLAAVNAQIGNLAANVATIDKLTVTHTAQINNLVATSATITDLHAINALINVLEANVGRIDTLVNGNLSSENIQAGGITSDKLTIENGFIKNAMISDLDVSKINAGDISTNKFKIKSDDGGIEIVGATQQFKDKNNKVRIQMGKDAKGDFNFIIRGEDGTTTLIDHTGVKEKAIADDLIKSNMIASNSVGEKQIDYSSFSEGFNRDTNTHTLKATKIKLNNQNHTLDVAFNQLKTQTDENKTITESNSTTIRVMQGQINTAINNTQIVKDGQIILLKDDYNRTAQTVNSMHSILGEHTTTLNQHTGEITGFTARVNEIVRNLEGITARVSSTETKLDNIQGRNLALQSNKLLAGSPAQGIVTSIESDGALKIISSPNNNNWFTSWYSSEEGINDKLKEGDTFTISFTMKSPNSTSIPKIYIKTGMGYYPMKGNLSPEYSTVYYTGTWKSEHEVNIHLGFGSVIGIYYIKNWKIEKGDKATDWSPAPEDIDDKIGILEARVHEAEVKVTSKAIIATVGSTFYNKNEADSRYAAQSQIEQLSHQITSKVDVNGVKSIIQQNSSDVMIGFNGINNRININPRSMDFTATNGYRDMSLYGGQLCTFNSGTNQFLGTLGSIIAPNYNINGAGFILSKYCNHFLIGRDANWDDIFTNRSPKPTHYLDIDFDNFQIKLGLALLTGDVNLRGNSLYDAQVGYIKDWFGFGWRLHSDGHQLIYADGHRLKFNVPVSFDGNELMNPKLYTNAFYFTNGHQAFCQASNGANIMMNGLHWDFNGFNIVNARLEGCQMGYSLMATSPGISVGADTASIETMLLQEDFSKYDELNNEVIVDMNEGFKSVYAKSKKLENENEQIKQEKENLIKELDMTKNALDNLLMGVS